MPGATDLASMSNTATQTYTSFSGVDIQAVLDGRIIGNLMGISYSVTREKAPRYVLGSTDPIGFARGKRGIAGSMIFSLFDRSALHGIIQGSGAGDGAKYYAKPTDVANPGEYAASRLSTTGEVATLGIPRETGLLFSDELIARRGAIGGVRANGQVLIDDLRPVNYVDQMPPFDVVLSAQNEMGHRMGMQLFGVELLNQGSGVSVDDIVIEAQMTFVCRSLLDWQPLGQGSDLTHGLPPNGTR